MENSFKAHDFTVLVVEDEESLLKLVSHILEMKSYRVLATPHSEAAYRKAKAHAGPIHLLLTDVRMDPHISGCKLALALRPLRPEMKVLYMSAFPASEIVRKEVENGTASLLRKPFTPTQLLSTVQSVLESAVSASSTGHS